MTLYFAYGSNMNRAAMARRCPAARAVGTAILEGHRFFVGIDGWGSVKPSAGGTVHGVLWRLTSRDIAALHAYELLHQGLYDVRHLAGTPGLAAGNRDDLSTAPPRARTAEARLRRDDRGFRARLAAAGALYPFGRALVGVALHRRARDRRRRTRMIRHVIVHGRVQGVGFRAFVEHAALKRGLEGWVRNRRDGSVEAVFAGEEGMVADMVEACRGGPLGARVDVLHQREGHRRRP